MKIAIITFHFPLNYGAVLQAYALTKTLQTIGHEVEIVDYQPTYQTRRYAWNWKWGGIHPRNVAFAVLRRRFAAFSRRYLPTTKRRYETLQQLIDSPPEADAYICGSDQIWNPDLTDLDAAYFLDFAPDGRKRIAYAASFGRGDLKKECGARLAPLLETFHYLSAREKSGIDLIEQFAGRRAEHVLDPTLLIDDYSSIVEAPSERAGYVLAIHLQNSPLLSQSTRLVAENLKRPLVIVNNYSLQDWTFSDKRRFPSPGGYLALIQQAEFLVTNSFHGTVFAIAMQKPFLTVSLSGEGAQKNSRITGLLDMAGLLNRYLDHFAAPEVRRIISNQIDWDSVAQNMAGYRESSMRFLHHALN